MEPQQHIPQNISGRGRHLLDSIEFDSDENVVCEIRKHPFGLFMIFLVGGTIAFILFSVLVLLPFALDASGQDFGFDFSTIKSIAALLGLLLTSLAVVMAAITGFLYQNNVVLVTSEKISQQIYRTIFDKKISQLNIGDIQDVTVEQRGILAKIFGYGTLVIETAGEQNNYIFNYAVNPFESSKLIVHAHEAYIAKYGN